MKYLDKLILIGGGGHCTACIDVIETEQRYQIQGILDVKEKIGQTLLGYPYIGSDEDLVQFINDDCHFLITIGHMGNAQVRNKLLQKIITLKGKLATVISPIAYVAKSASIGQGSIVMHHALINSQVTIGDNCIINSKALVEHDCVIENNCHISTASTINGNVCVKESSFIGSNAVCIQGVSVEKNSFIKANRCFSGISNPKVAVLTTIFPMQKQFVVDFFESMQSQSFSQFTIIMLNDGFKNFNEIKLQFPKLSIIELPAAGSIAKNRAHLLQFAKVNNFQKVIFADSDDTFSKNRISASLKGLIKADIVVNDLTSVRNGQVENEKIYSQRLTNRTSISLDFILHKNLLGLSNTAINLNAVPISLINFPDELVAVDWYFFSLLLMNGATAHFTQDCITYYRQHDSNTIGVGSINSNLISQIINTKELHYKNLQHHGPQYTKLLLEIQTLKAQISNKKYLEKLITLNSNLTKPLFWWELQVCTDEIN